MVVNYSQTAHRHTLLDACLLFNIEKQVCEITKGTIFSILDLKPAYYQVAFCTVDPLYTAFKVDRKLYQDIQLPFVITKGVSSFQGMVDQLIEKHNLKGTYAYVDNINIKANVTPNAYILFLNCLFSAVRRSSNELLACFCATQNGLLIFRKNPTPNSIEPCL